MQKYKITASVLELLEKMSEDMNCVTAYDFNVLLSSYISPAGDSGSRPDGKIILSKLSSRVRGRFQISHDIFIPYSSHFITDNHHTAVRLILRMFSTSGHRKNG